MDLRGNQPRDVRHVGDDGRVDLPSHASDPLEVDDARVSAGTDHDHLRLVLVSQALELVVIDPLVILADAVRDDRVELAGEVEGVAVRQVTAVREVHAEHRLARLQEREVDGHVGLRA